MGHKDNLRGFTHLTNELIKTTDIGVVQRRVDFIQHAERTRTNEEQGKGKTQRRKRLLTTGEELQRTQPLPRRLHRNLDATLGEVLSISEFHLSLSPFHESRIDFTKLGVHQLKGLAEAFARLTVQFRDSTLQVSQGPL